MFLHLLLEGSMNRAGKVLRINVEDELLAKRSTQLSGIALAVPCLFPILVDISIIVCRFRQEINEIISDFGQALVLIDNYSPIAFATVFAWSNTGVPSYYGREDNR